MSETSKASVNAGQLARALKAVIPHADTNKNHPKQHCLKFEAVDHGLAVIATDGYTLGCYRIPSEGDDLHDFDMLLSLEDVKKLETLARGAHNIHDIELTVEDGGKVIIRSFGFEWETRDLLPELDYLVWQLPLVNNVDAGEIEVPAAASFNALHLARFKNAVATGDKRLVLRHGAEGKPTVVYAENFVGLIMPTALKEDAEGDWVPGRVVIEAVAS